VKKPLEVTTQPKIQLEKFLPERYYRCYVPFAAESVTFDLLHLFWGKTGTTETSAPVSTRNLVFETRSITNKWRVFVSGVFCAGDTPAISFPLRGLLRQRGFALSLGEVR